MLALDVAVPLARIQDELRLAPGLDERLVHLLGLADGHAQVLLPVHHQRRRLRVLRLDDGRARVVLAADLVGIGVEEQLVETPDVRGQVEAAPVGHRGERDRGAEAIRLRDRPR